MRRSCLALLFCIGVLVSDVMAAPQDSSSAISAVGDSIASQRRLEIDFQKKTEKGQTLSILGLCLDFGGDIVPWLLANPRNTGSAGGFLVAGLGLTTVGSTMAGIGTTVIHTWSTDHVKDPPEARVWTFYKVGMVLTYVGALGIVVGVNSHSLGMLLDYGVPGYLVGETFLLISCVKSVVYTTSVNARRERREYDLVAMPTIDLRKGAGLVLVLTVY